MRNRISPRFGWRSYLSRSGWRALACLHHPSCPTSTLIYGGLLSQTHWHTEVLRRDAYPAWFAASWVPEHGCLYPERMPPEAPYTDLHHALYVAMDAGGCLVSFTFECLLHPEPAARLTAAQTLARLQDTLSDAQRHEASVVCAQLACRAVSSSVMRALQEQLAPM